MFKRILVTNRGLMQSLTIKAIQELGATAVTICMPGKFATPHRLLADEVYESKKQDNIHLLYDKTALLDIAKTAKVDAVHPGYGFLSENFHFANELKKSNITYISSINLVDETQNSKKYVHKIATELGIKTPRQSVRCSSFEELKDAAKNFKFPFIVKPAFGLGAQGVMLVKSIHQLNIAYNLISILADSHRIISKDVIIEQHFGSAQQFEFPILRDKSGNIAVLPEINCSIQRRFSPFILESPAINIKPELIKQLRVYCRQLAERLKIVGVIYAEFFIINNEAYFNSINFSIQPSFLLTFELTGINILKHQINLIAGERLTFSEQDIKLRGHSIATFINAESPENNFIPSTGVIEHDFLLGAPGTTIYKTLTAGDEVPSNFEPRIAEYIVTDDNRRLAIAKLKSALSTAIIEGVKSNLSFLKAVIASNLFKNCEYNLEFLRNPKILQELLASSIPFGEKELASLVATLSLQSDNVGRQKLISERQGQQDGFSLWGKIFR